MTDKPKHKWKIVICHAAANQKITKQNLLYNMVKNEKNYKNILQKYVLNQGVMLLYQVIFNSLVKYKLLRKKKQVFKHNPGCYGDVH